MATKRAPPSPASSAESFEAKRVRTVAALMAHWTPDEDEPWDDSWDGLADTHIEEANSSTTSEIDERRRQGREKELKAMDQFNLYTVVPRDCVDWTKYVSGRWEEQERGDEIRSRWVLRQFKRGDPRDDVFAVASTGATSMIIDYIGVSRGLVFFTADAKNAFWHVPIDED